MFRCQNLAGVQIANGSGPKEQQGRLGPCLRVRPALGPSEAGADAAPGPPAHAGREALSAVPRDSFVYRFCFELGGGGFD